MLDYLIVGGGLTGIALAHLLEEQGHSFRLIADRAQGATGVAGGLYNPVILKRFTLAYRAEEQIDGMDSFYKSIEAKLQQSVDEKLEVFRIFHSVEEQNNWFAASDKPGLERFLSATIHQNTNEKISAPHGLGKVLETGRVDTAKLQTAYLNYLDHQGWLLAERLNHKELKHLSDGVHYKDLQAQRIVFAEGFGLKQNPFFNYLPLTGTKGELLTIHCPGLQLSKVIKAGVFIIPMGNDLYRIGATYKWKDKTETTTAESREELLQKLAVFLEADFKVVDHRAGIRPTVTDRRPLVGQHPEYAHYWLLNGMGSRGVMTAPFAAELLYKSMEEGQALPEEIDIARFSDKWNATA
jgi:glycine/D-amino acid oxidase-like deaminating enzyme